MPVAAAVDLGRTTSQIEAAIRPLLPAGHQPRLFGRAVTVECEPPDFGAAPLAIDRNRPGPVLVTTAGGHAETAKTGQILSGRIYGAAAQSV